MEILESHDITTISGLYFIAVAVGASFVTFLFAALCTGKKQTALWCGIVVIIAGIILFTVNPYPTVGKTSYTVEITDNSKYKELVESGYKFSRVYENRNIYIIEGDILE